MKGKSLETLEVIIKSGAKKAISDIEDALYRASSVVEGKDKKKFDAALGTAGGPGDETYVEAQEKLRDKIIEAITAHFDVRVKPVPAPKLVVKKATPALEKKAKA
jgi:hypothetical protein